MYNGELRLQKYNEYNSIAPLASEKRNVYSRSHPIKSLKLQRSVTILSGGFVRLRRKLPKEVSPTALRMSTIETGEKYTAKLGRSGFRKNFHFGKTWHGKFYKTKQLEVIAVEETMDVWIALTVITKYF